MRAFITGIAGFAGSFLAEHLLACGDQVAGCTVDGSWPNSLPAALTRNAEIAAWDVSQLPPTSLVRRLEEWAPDVVFHLAAISIPADCGHIEPTPQAVRVNVGGTGSVVELAAQLSSRPHVILVSSCRVYAPVGQNARFVSEASPLAPLTGYAKTKLAAEELLHRQGARLGVRGMVIRAFNHAGPRQPPKLMLSEWCRQLVRGDCPVQVQSLDSYLDMTDVRDVVRAYRLLALKGRPGETYNVGGGVSLRSGDIFEQLRQMHDPQRPFVELAPGRRQGPIADLTKLQAAIAWRPEIPLTDTLRATLEYWSAVEGNSAH